MVRIKQNRRPRPDRGLRPVRSPFAAPETNARNTRSYKMPGRQQHTRGVGHMRPAREIAASAASGSDNLATGANLAPLEHLRESASSLRRDFQNVRNAGRAAQIVFQHVEFARRDADQIGARHVAPNAAVKSHALLAIGL